MHNLSIYIFRGFYHDLRIIAWVCPFVFISLILICFGSINCGFFFLTLNFFFVRHWFSLLSQVFSPFANFSLLVLCMRQIMKSIDVDFLVNFSTKSLILFSPSHLTSLTSSCLCSFSRSCIFQQIVPKIIIIIIIIIIKIKNKTIINYNNIAKFLPSNNDYNPIIFLFELNPRNIIEL